MSNGKKSVIVGVIFGLIALGLQLGGDVFVAIGSGILFFLLATAFTYTILEG